MALDTVEADLLSQLKVLGTADVAGVVVAEVTAAGMATDTDAEIVQNPQAEAWLEPLHGMDLTDVEMRRYGRLVDSVRLAS